jgi:hypothetical protein
MQELAESWPDTAHRPGQPRHRLVATETGGRKKRAGLLCQVHENGPGLENGSGIASVTVDDGGYLSFGETERNAGKCCSPDPMFTRRTESGLPTSSSMIEGFVPFGVGHVNNSIMIWSLLEHLTFCGDPDCSNFCNCGPHASAGGVVAHLQPDAHPEGAALSSLVARGFYPYVHRLE